MTLKKILLTLLLLSFAPFFSVSASAGIKKNRTETAELKKKEEERSPKKGTGKKEKPSKSFSKKVVMTAISLIKGLTMLVGAVVGIAALSFLTSSNKEAAKIYFDLEKAFEGFAGFYEEKRKELERKELEKQNELEKRKELEYKKLKELES